MKSAIAHKIPNQSRSNAAGLQGKGVSLPAPNPVVQRKVEVKNYYEKSENSDVFEKAVSIFLSTVKGDFFELIEKSDSSLELLIYGDEVGGNKSGITSGVTSAYIGEKPQKEDGSNSLSFPEKVNWKKIDKKSPFRIEIGINLDKKAHESLEDMVVTLLHEWYVHGVTWAEKYNELRKSENPEKIFSGYKYQTAANREHREYVLGNTGMDSALGNLSLLAERFSKGNATEKEKKTEAYKYFNQTNYKENLDKIKVIVQKDVEAHDTTKKKKFKPESWKNLSLSTGGDDEKELGEVGKNKRERKEFGDELIIEKDTLDLLNQNIKKKKKKEVVDLDKPVKNNN